MQTKQTTSLRTTAKAYVTIVEQASAKVRGFKQLYKEIERAINVSGKSTSTVTNYGRQLAHLALHSNCLPTALDNEQVLDYLHHVKSKGTRRQRFSRLLSTACGMPAKCADLIMCSSLYQK